MPLQPQSLGALVRSLMLLCPLLLPMPSPAAAFEGDLTDAQVKQLTAFGIRATFGLDVGPDDIKQQLSRSDLAEMVAVGLNSNGLLCANVVSVQSLAKDGYYEVSCVAYRGGSGQKHYIVEAATGIAFEE